MFYQISLPYLQQIRMYPLRGQLYLKKRNPEGLNRACSVPFLRRVNKFLFLPWGGVSWRGGKWANKCSPLTSSIKANCTHITKIV